MNILRVKGAHSELRRSLPLFQGQVTPPTPNPAHTTTTTTNTTCFLFPLLIQHANRSPVEQLIRRESDKYRHNEWISHVCPCFLCIIHVPHVLRCVFHITGYVVALPPSEGFKCWETGHCLGLKMCEMTWKATMVTLCKYQWTQIGFSVHSVVGFRFWVVWNHC